MIVYNKNLEKWEKDEEYKRECFAIVDPPKRTNAKQLNIPEGENYETWKKK